LYEPGSEESLLKTMRLALSKKQQTAGNKGFGKVAAQTNERFIQESILVYR